MIPNTVSTMHSSLVRGLGSSGVFSRAPITSASAGRGKITLGPFDRSGRELTGDPQIGQPLTLQAARQLAATVHRDRALGHDVVADHRARRHRQRTEIEERAANTFGAGVCAYIDEYARQETRNWLEPLGSWVCVTMVMVNPKKPSRIHDLRHTFASLLVSGGMTLPIEGLRRQTAKLSAVANVTHAR